MTTYAVADKVPEGCDYLTVGKEYEVIDDVTSDFFIIVSDRNMKCLGKWQACEYLNGGNWRRVEK